MARVEEKDEVPLYESKGAKGRLLFKLYAASVLVGIHLIWVYRAIHTPKVGEEGRWVWVGVFVAEVCFGLYWVLTQSVRLDPIFHHTFRDRLSQRYENELPHVDIFVCTADPIIEPPMLVINTVLSAMTYDYPGDKLSVYLSDDGGSELTFYAILEAASFSKHWIPYCMKFKVEQRSPAAYFTSIPDMSESYNANEFPVIKKLYKEMENRVEATIELGRISEELRKQHKGFSGWNSETTPWNHQPIVEILIDGRDRDSVDVGGMTLPTLVYVAREKRPQYPHNFKAGAVNALVEFPGFEHAMLVGTGCFHRRDSLCGRRYTKNYKMECNNRDEIKSEDHTSVIEERAKSLASCNCEQNTEWGKDMGMMYGCPVEDVITGLSIHCKGWRSIYYNPPKKSFLGMAPLTLGQLLVQHKRWGEGMFQIFLSKFCPFIYGHGKIKLKLQMSYCLYLLWAPISLPMLYYVVVPSLCLLKGVSLFPKIASPWFIPFAYVFIATQAYSLAECLWCGETLTSWWNIQKMKMMRRTSSYFFSFIDTIRQKLGIGNFGFIVTAKVTENDALERSEKGIMEFGSYSPLFVALAMLAMLNLICLVGGVIRVAMQRDGGYRLGEQMTLQFLLCGLLVIGNLPIYQALFFRKGKGCLPTSIALQSALLATLACVVPLYSG